jgi:large subunit ribosomal protein L13
VREYNLESGRPTCGPDAVLGLAESRPAAMIRALRSRLVPRFASFTGQSRRDSIQASLKTYVATPSTRDREWLLVDASGKTLGRLATQIADALRGKRKPEYTPHIDTGDFVVVVNAEKVRVTGNKRKDKLYHRHSGYPGGLRTRTLDEMLARRPEEVIRLAVKGMLPRNRLGRQQLGKLKVYAGQEHPHAAQKPRSFEDTK